VTRRHSQACQLSSQGKGNPELYVARNEKDETKEALLKDIRRQGTYSDGSNADISLVLQ